MKIIPALLAGDEKEALRLLSLVELMKAEYLHVDVMDGRFVPSMSVPAEFWLNHPPQIPWAVHLMVEDPASYLESFFRAGAKRITFHYEAEMNPGQVLKQIKALGLKSGIALNPDTQPAKLEPYLPDLDYTLVMSVNPGFYGSSFLPETLNKIPVLRSLGGHFAVGIDGGISLETFPLVKQAGVEEVNIGSYLFKAQNPLENYQKLLALA